MSARRVSSVSLMSGCILSGFITSVSDGAGGFRNTTSTGALQCPVGWVDRKQTPQFDT